MLMKPPLLKMIWFKIFINDLVVYNYENIEISKNRPIGGLSSKKGMSL